MATVTAGLSRDQITKKLLRAATKRQPYTAQELVERAGLHDAGYDARGVARFIGEMIRDGILIRHKARRPKYTKAS